MWDMQIKPGVAVAPPRYKKIQAVRVKRRGKAAVREESWGWLPVLSLTSSSGLLLISFANTIARLGTRDPQFLLWSGLLVLFAPIAARLFAARVSRRERIGLVVLLGLALYLVKILQSPVAFTYHDEFLHLRTAEDILQSGHLFSGNSLLPASALYPGLEIVSNAVSRLTGWSVFDAGILEVGAAHLVLILALFLLYEEIGQSARIAGIATLLYMANPHYVFFDAQFAYESLALPFGVLILYAVARLSRHHGERLGLVAIAVLGLGAVVVTHHLTSFAFVAFLLLLPVLALVTRDHTTDRVTLTWIAVIGILATGGWLLVVAGPVADYLAPIAMSAVQQVLQIITREVASRPLFTDYSGQAAPLWERAMSLGSVGLILLGLPWGFLEIWRRRPVRPIVLAFAAASLVYLASLPLRFTQTGGEIAARSAEYLFVALGFVLAIGPGERWLEHHAEWKRVGVLTVFSIVLFLGGYILGAGPEWAQLPGPYLVSADMRSIEPQGISAAQWAHSFLPPNSRVAADRINRLLMSAYGGQRPVTNVGDGVNVAPVYFATQFKSEDEALLVRGDIRYLVVDMRLSTGLPRLGVYFEQGEPESFQRKTPVDAEALAKFDHIPGISRIYDGGSIVIYDVGGLSHAP